jgi:acetyl-CoA carboxylase carboxyl transferase subunit beta
VGQDTVDRSQTTIDWIRCGGCRTLVYARRYTRHLSVCPDCGDHGRLTAAQRLDQLLDPDCRRPLAHPGADEAVMDPLEFVDVRPYRVRLREARARTGLSEAVVCARGAIDGSPVVVAAMDFRFLGGSLGTQVGDLVRLAASTALRDRVPLVLVTASGGARMQEGAYSLMQMARTSQALAELDEAGILTISVITDPTYGGVAASFATLADIILAEPGARMGFAGPRVIEQTIRQRLPEGFQTAEFLLARGLVDGVEPRASLRPVLARLVRVGRPWRPPSGVDGDDPVIRDPTVLPERPAWEVVKLARDSSRPSTLDYASYLLDGFQELHGDRLGDDCAAIVGGLGWLDGTPVMLIGHQKGHTTAELVACNFGMPRPAGYRKSARLMRLAAKLGVPVVTLVDTPGAYPGIEAEERGQAVAIAENLRLMSGLPVPVVAVITGEGGSGGALALAVGNQVLACANATYSVISPEGCAAILWKSASAAPKAAASLRLDARELLCHGIVDGVVPEPPGGTQTSHVLAADRLREAIVASLHGLRGYDGAQLVRQRRQRYDRFASAVGGN